ncbi:unnamed protein product [Clonostachys solani]|uniref:Amino acid permease/ SLC12A domain-containing protein n=1 Tax=Clonostachys solani TaxID=160281 RepID=A0A9N9Z0W1_9HYPO|nr:unnamed protein product [Clonostachys solani]
MDHPISKTMSKAEPGDAIEHGDTIAVETQSLSGQAAEVQLHRTLRTRHLSMIGLGASIGLGLWLGSGQSLRTGGPAALLIGYCLAGSVVWSVSQSIGEMAILYPLPSAFVQWTSKFVDPAAAFALGWSYWFHAWITIANELQGVLTVLSFWQDSAPRVAILISFWALIFFINIWAVNVFAEVEFVAAVIKFGWIFVVLVSFIVISAGGAPNHVAVGFRYWNEAAFTNGFKGLLMILPTCIFAMASSENIGMVVAETRNPLKSTPPAVRAVWIRLSIFYIFGALAVTITVDPKDSRLFGGSGSTGASPFVIAYQNGQLMPLAHMMNAIIFISVISAGSIAAYAGSRTLFMQKADSRGRPWFALVSTVFMGGALSFLNLNATGAEVFTWLSSLASLTTLFSWSMICLSHIRMRYAWKVQGRSPAELPWTNGSWPLSAYWGLGCCIILLVAEFYIAVWPLGKTPSAVGFFSRFVSAIAILVIYVAARCYYRGRRWVNVREVDLDNDRRFYHVEDQAEKSTPWIDRLRKRTS